MSYEKLEWDIYSAAILVSNTWQKGESEKTRRLNGKVNKDHRSDHGDRIGMRVKKHQLFIWHIFF